MEYKIKLTKEGRGEALYDLLLRFADLKLSGTVRGIKQITKDADSAEAVVTFDVDSLIKLAVGEGFRRVALDIFEFAKVDIEATAKKKTQTTQESQTKKTSKSKSKKRAKKI